MRRRKLPNFDVASHSDDECDNATHSKKPKAKPDRARKQRRSKKSLASSSGLSLSDGEMIDNDAAKFESKQMEETQSTTTAPSDDLRWLVYATGNATDDVSILKERLPSSLAEVLMPFQREGILFGIKHEGRVLIGDEMGLGKTLQAIGLASVYQDDWPVVVLMPASMRWVWADELEKWLPMLRPGDVKVVKSGADTDGLETGRFKFILVTYDLFTRSEALQLALQACGCGVCIVDESHYCKNRDAKRSQAVARLAKACRRCFMLSGTPALNRPAELYPQITALQEGLLGSWSAFTKRYCDGHRGRFGWECRGATNLDELSEKLRSVMIRRRKMDVLKQLPPKRRQQIPLELDSRVTEAMRSELRRMWATPEGSERNRLWSEAMQKTAVEKTPLAADYVVDLINGGAKALVFGHYHSTLDGIETQLARAKISYVRIDGNVTGTDRQAAVRRFQTEETVRVALLGILAAGQGITLTAATTVVFAELHVTPGILVQAEDRAHRIGQSSAVNVHYLCARGTVDDAVWRMISRKLDVVSRTLSGQAERLEARRLEQGAIGDFLPVEGRVVAQTDGGGDINVPPAEIFDFSLGDTLTARDPPPADIRSFFGKGAAATQGPLKAVPPLKKDASDFARRPARSLIKNKVPPSTIALSQDSKPTTRHLNGSIKSGSKRVFVASDDDEQGAVRLQILPSEVLVNSDAGNSQTFSSSIEGELDSHDTSKHIADSPGHRNQLASPPAACRASSPDTVARQNSTNLSTMSAVKEYVVDLTDELVDLHPLRAQGLDDSSDFSAATSELPENLRNDCMTESKALVRNTNLACNISTQPERVSHSVSAELSFQVSGNTQRIYVYTDKEGRECLGSIHGRAVQEGAEHPPWVNSEVLRALSSFHSEWTNLRAIDRQQLADKILVLPLSRAIVDLARETAAAAAAASGRRARSPEQEDSPSDAGKKPRHTSELPFGDCEGMEGCVGLRFCSVSCSERFAVCASSSAVRRQLYELEKGVCQLCGVDAHALYVRIKALPQGPERLQAVMETRMRLKGRLDKILKAPQAGDFWQADHIKPVAEGGGEADISGFRTLCTPCHEAETARLLLRLAAGRRRADPAVAGTGDIRRFFFGGGGAAAATGGAAVGGR